jgi:dolichol-phosphate mannosyltransferase
MSIAIIIPAFKESDNIEKLIFSILKILKDPIIVIVDDSPNKEIQEKIKNFNNIRYIYRGKKLGRGSAVIEGMKNLVNEKEISKIIEMDADLSHDPSEINNNLKIFEKDNLDLLISSRYLKDSRIINWNLSRKIFSLLANRFAKFVLKIPITDYTNGFRIYSRNSIKHIVLNCGKIGGGFIILSEILVELYCNNFKVKEVPSVFKNRIRGESSVTLRLILNSFFGLLKIYKKKIKLINKINQKIV